MKAIETSWRGFRFRSRTEARWAVFLDAYGAAWEYEPETVRLPSGRLYLPDFHVKLNEGEVFWIEVKPDIGCDESDLEGPRHVGAYVAFGSPGPFLPLHDARSCLTRRWRNSQLCNNCWESCFCLNDRHEHRTWHMNNAAWTSEITDTERWDWCGPLARKAIETARRERFGAHE